MTLVAYSWTNNPAPGIVPMVWATVSQSKDATDAVAKADAAADALLTRPATDRVLFLWDPFPGNPWEDGAKAALFGCSDSAMLGLYEAFFTRLSQRVEPALVVADYENVPDYWTLTERGTEAMLARVREVPAAKRLLPTALQDIDISKFSGYGTWVEQWHQFVNTRMVRTLFERNIAGPYRTVYGRQPKISNWWSERVGRLERDDNGLVMPDLDQVPYGVSSPDCYLCDFGGAYQGKAMAPEWYRFLNRLNWLRAIQMTGDRLLPWLPALVHKFDDKEPPIFLYGELMKHLYAMGCRSILYWNIDGDDRAMIDLLAQSQAWPGDAPKHLPQIDDGADQVKTGSVLTRYADFAASIAATV